MKAIKPIILFFVLLFVNAKTFSQALTVSVPTLACLNQTVQLSADTMGVSAWSINITPSETTLSLNSKNSEILITFTSCGTHTISGEAYDYFAAPIPGSLFSQTVDVLCVNTPTIVIVPVFSSVCVGFTSTITAFGADSYTWLPSATAQQSLSVGAGTYTVIGENSSGCQSQNTISIGLALPLTIITSQSSQTTCIMSNSPQFSKPVQLTAAGAGTYVWAPSDPNNPQYGSQITVRPSSSTCYTVTGTSPNCKGSAEVCVTVIPQFPITVAPPSPTICLSESVLLSVVSVGVPAVGPSSAYTYSWSEVLNTSPISLSGYFTQTVIAYPQISTTYTVEVRDAINCISLPRLINVSVEGNCTGIIETNKAEVFTLYPNPVTDKLYLRTTINSPVSFKIINLIGEVIVEQQKFIDGDVFEIPIQSIPQGVYSFVLETDGDSVKSKIFVKF